MRRITSICVMLLLLASVSAPAAMATARAVLRSCCPEASQKHSCCPEMEHDCDMSAPDLSFRAEPSSCCPACLLLTAGPITSPAVQAVMLTAPQAADVAASAPIPVVPFLLFSSSQRGRAPPVAL